MVVVAGVVARDAAVVVRTVLMLGTLVVAGVEEVVLLVDVEEVVSVVVVKVEVVMVMVVVVVVVVVVAVVVVVKVVVLEAVCATGFGTAL